MLFSVKPSAGTLRYTGTLISGSGNIVPSTTGSVAFNVTFPLPFSPAVFSLQLTTNEPLTLPLEVAPNISSVLLSISALL